MTTAQLTAEIAALKTELSDLKAEVNASGQGGASANNATNQTRPHPRMSIPRFSGSLATGEVSVGSWIDNMDALQRKSSLSSDDMMDLLQEALVGQAKTHYNAMKDAGVWNTLTWDEAKAQFLEAYDRPLSILQRGLLLTSFTMHSNEVMSSYLNRVYAGAAQYLSSFRNVRTLNLAVPDDYIGMVRGIAITMAVAGLSPNLRSKLHFGYASDDWASFSKEASDVAAAVDESQSRLYVKQLTQATEMKESEKDRNKNDRSEKSAPPILQVDAISQRKCYNCGDPSHMKNMCPLPYDPLSPHYPPSWQSRGSSSRGGRSGRGGRRGSRGAARGGNGRGRGNQVPTNIHAASFSPYIQAFQAAQAALAAQQPNFNPTPGGSQQLPPPPPPESSQASLTDWNVWSEASNERPDHQQQPF